MGDELSKRRHQRQRQHIMRQNQRPLVPPPMDGSIDQVVEDLAIVGGMTEEILAETRALPEVPERLHRAVVAIDDAVHLAQQFAEEEAGKT